MNCATCGLEIEGGRYGPDTILVAQSTHPRLPTYRLGDFATIKKEQ